jgi:hypothetical protein
MMFEISKFREMAMRGERLEGEYIVDAHTHIGGYSRTSHVPKSSTQEIIEEMDRLGVDKAVMLPFYGTTSDFAFGNDIAADAVAHYPDRFVGLASVNPYYHFEIEDELERCREMGLRGVRLISDVQVYPVESPAFFPAYDYAHSHRWIMENQHWGPPQFFDNVATTFSRACFIVGRFSLIYSNVIAKHDNIFQCTAGAVNFADISKLLDVVPSDKVVFGSDFPELPLMFSMGPILYARISDDDKRNILGLTAKGMLERWSGNA